MTARTALEQGRAAVERETWGEAFARLSEADAEAPLGAEDLESLALAAYMGGLDAEGQAAFERAHHAFFAAGELDRAIRVAFWLFATLSNRGEAARAGGWAARAARLAEELPDGVAGRGYVAMGEGMRAIFGGDAATAAERFAAAGDTGERHGDADLVALARHGLGRALIASGRPAEGVALLDEVMASLTGGELLPMVVGIVYCSVIEACHELFDVRRAQEWTAALTRWCERRQEMVPYRGQCLIYRSELMQLSGAWPDAIKTAEQAQALLSRPPVHPSVGGSLYQQAELHRLRGEFARAESAYREASRRGRPPEPGLALLRLAQGRGNAADAAIRRVLGEAQDRPVRSRLLPAFVEIVLAAGDAGAARVAADELTAVAEALDAPLLRAFAAHAQGEVLLAEGDPGAALGALRRGWSAWQTLEAPYEAARTRVLIARACHALGDADTAELELDAARRAFRELGAAPDLAAVERLTARAPARAAGGLTAREVEVLRLVASGRTNRELASELVISEKTVARHVSNILGKLELSSRAAATAYAYEHGLLGERGARAP